MFLKLLRLIKYFFNYISISANTLVFLMIKFEAKSYHSDYLGYQPSKTLVQCERYLPKERFSHKESPYTTVNAKCERFSTTLSSYLAAKTTTSVKTTTS